VSATVERKKSYHHYFTFTTYANKNSVKFAEKSDNEIVKNIKKCPNDCNGKGRCNTYNGKCTCYPTWEGSDCS